MAINPAPVMARLVAILTGLTGTPALTVYTGAPATLAGLLNAYVTQDRWVVLDGPPGNVTHEIDFGVTFAYRVGTDSTTAEQTLPVRVGLFITALLAERRSNAAGSIRALGGSLPANYPDFSRAADPQYAPVAGREFRLYPGIVRVHYQESF